MVAADGVCDICLIGVHFASEIRQGGSPYILAALGGTAVAGIVESLGNFSIVPSVDTGGGIHCCVAVRRSPIAALVDLSASGVTYVKMVFPMLGPSGNHKAPGTDRLGLQSFCRPRGAHLIGD